MKEKFYLITKKRGSFDENLLHLVEKIIFPNIL